MIGRSHGLLLLSAAILLTVAGCAVPKSTRFQMPFVPPAAVPGGVTFAADPPPPPPNIYLNGESPISILGQHRQIPAPTRSDEFWAQSAVDRSNGAVWMCFYDTAGDRAARRARYTCTVSRDGGQRWSRTVRAASLFSDETQKGASYEYGYYQGLAVTGGVAHPIWTDTRKLATLKEESYTSHLTGADMPAPGRR